MTNKKKNIKSYEPFWFCSFGGCEGASKECINNCEMSIFVKERKKILTDIFQKLKAKQIICSLKEDNFVYMIDIIQVIKQCGVEVEE